jgi:hypothetical protein
VSHEPDPVWALTASLASGFIGSLFSRPPDPARVALLFEAQPPTHPPPPRPICTQSCGLIVNDLWLDRSAGGIAEWISTRQDCYDVGGTPVASLNANP